MDSYDHLFNLTYFLYKLGAISWDTLQPFTELDAMANTDAYTMRLHK